MSVDADKVAGTISYAHNFKSPEQQKIERSSGIAAWVGMLGAVAALAWGAVAGVSQPETCSVVPSGVEYDSGSDRYNLDQNTESQELRADLSDGQQVRIIGGAACR